MPFQVDRGTKRTENCNRSLSTFVGIWRSRNARIFDHIVSDVQHSILKILAFFQEIGPWRSRPFKRTSFYKEIGLSKPVGFIDEIKRGMRVWNIHSSKSWRVPSIQLVCRYLRYVRWLEIDEIVIVGLQNGD